jgi:Protein of unknown function (DUF1552)
MKNFSRRFLMKALGVGFALPALDAFVPTQAKAQLAAAEHNFVVYYLPNGRVPEWWVPSGTVGDLQFPQTAAALQPFASRVISFDGLSNNAAMASPGAAHAMGTTTVLTGTRITNLQGGLQASISIDQVVANRRNGQHRFPSIQWSAGEPGPCDVGGSPCAYTQSLSWAGRGTPLSPMIDPRSAFDRLFSSGADGLSGIAGDVRRRSHGSVLDFLSGDAADLGEQMGVTDRARLDEYLTAVRELELRVKDMGETCDLGQAPGAGLAYPERVEAFHDLMSLALSCGQTSVVSFMIEFGLSGRSHAFLDAPGGHHQLSHNQTPDGRAQLERVERWQAEKLGSFLAKLQAKEGRHGGTLLDETIVLVMPSMGFGNPHDHSNVAPMIFGGDTVLATNGRRFNAGGASLCNLHVTLMDALGIAENQGPDGARFGDDGQNGLSGVVL